MDDCGDPLLDGGSTPPASTITGPLFSMVYDALKRGGRIA